MRKMMFVLLVVSLAIALVPQTAQAVNQQTAVMTFVRNYNTRVPFTVIWGVWQTQSRMLFIFSPTDGYMSISNCEMLLGVVPVGCSHFNTIGYDIQYPETDWWPAIKWYNDKIYISVETDRQVRPEYYKAIWQVYNIGIIKYIGDAPQDPNAYPAPMMGEKVEPTATPAAKSKKTKVPAYP